MSKNRTKDAWRLIRAAMNTAPTREGKNRIEEMNVYSGDELSDDYSAEVVVVGNWNGCDVYDKMLQMRVPTDKTPERLGRALDSLSGVELEWGDCSSTCDSCGKLVSTNPDSYGWLPQYVVNDEGLCCLECLDPAEHLESLEGNPRAANTISDVDPSEHDYFRIEEALEAGWHRGQDANPHVIAKALEKRGLTRFLFQIDDKGQFDVRFSVWLHESEREEWEKKEADLSASEINGPSNSEALQRGLQEATLAANRLDGEGTKYVKIEGDRVVEARVIRPEEL